MYCTLSGSAAEFSGAVLSVPGYVVAWVAEDGDDAVAKAAADRPDAIFCGSDQIARGVADTLRMVGHRVPDDVALVGFDNWDVMALGSQPPLTSLDMDLEGLGRTAADLLRLTTP